MDGVSQNLTIPLIGGKTMVVPAEVYGPLAVWKDSGTWNITHVRTGAALFRIADKKKVAIEVIGILLLAHDVDWEFGEFGARGLKMSDRPGGFLGGT